MNTTPSKMRNWFSENWLMVIIPGLALAALIFSSLVVTEPQRPQAGQEVLTSLKSAQHYYQTHGTLTGLTGVSGPASMPHLVSTLVGPHGGSVGFAWYNGYCNYLVWVASPSSHQIGATSQYVQLPGSSAISVPISGPGVYSGQTEPASAGFCFAVLPTNPQNPVWQRSNTVTP